MNPIDSSIGSALYDLTGRVAIVTGGGRSFGPLLAERLAAAGAAVAVVARTKVEVTATAERIAAGGGQALAIAVDVSDRMAVEAMVTQVQHALGTVDVLVNNAALLRALGPVWEVESDQWWREIEVNLRGPFLCTRSVLPGMIAHSGRRIINVASAAGTWPTPAGTAYAASKAALINFTDSLAAETRAYGISVFAVDPGTMRTPMNEHLLESSVMRQWHPWFHQLFEEGRETPPEPAAQLVLALAFGQADRLSGRFISVYDDLDDVVRRAETIVREDLHTLRVRR